MTALPEETTEETALPEELWCANYVVLTMLCWQLELYCILAIVYWLLYTRNTFRRPGHGYG